jgi:hypothetical protein
MRNIKNVGLRSSIGAAVAATVTLLIALTFESPYIEWGKRGTADSEHAAVSTPATNRDVRDV